MEKIVEKLSKKEREIIYECLCVAELEEIFPEWEFETLFGIDRKKLSHVREKWPEVNVGDLDTRNAIVGAMNNLLGYPWKKQVNWADYISVPSKEVRFILDKLISLGL